MKRYRSILLLSPLVAVIISAAFYFGSGSSKPENVASSVPAVTIPAKSAPVSEASAETKADEPLFNSRLSPEAGPEAFSSNPPPDEDEARVLKVAQSNLPDAVKVEQLLSMIPMLPPEAKLVAMENAAQLIPDGDYLRYRGRLFQLSQSDELRETVMLDVLTRGEELRLPSLVEMLRLPPHKGQTEAREILEAYLDKDYGPDPSKWEAPLRLWLAENVEQ